MIHGGVDCSFKRFALIFQYIWAPFAPLVVYMSNVRNSQYWLAFELPSNAFDNNADKGFKSVDICRHL